MGNFKDVAVIDVLVKPGDAIEVEGPLVTLETEKATMDVPSTVAGIVDKILATKGGTVSPGDVVATVRVEEGAGAAPAAAAAPAAPATAAPAARPAAAPAAAPAPAAKAAAPAVAPPPAGTAKLAAVNEGGFSAAHASPSVRRFARELGVDLARVNGTGFKSRITEDDVKGFVKQALSAGGAAGKAAAQGGRGLPSVPVVDFAAFGPVESKPLTRIQKISGSRLHASWVNLPHVTQFDEADITELEELRAKLKSKATEQGIKLTPLAFIIRACVRALHHFPTFNSSLDASGENLILKKYVHIGFAADTPNGLMVPVVRDADRKDIYEVARALGELSEKARTGTLNVAQMQGGSFTISSLGGIGGTAFTPIINAPEVAILGVSRSVMKPVFQDGAFVPRLMLPLSLSYDHRVIDGALAAKFTTYLAKTLAEPRGLLEAVP
jgi:pyruvate dehydrogenase E2 component (dihydrolipoamide acetyltransferase)